MSTPRVAANFFNSVSKLLLLGLLTCIFTRETLLVGSLVFICIFYLSCLEPLDAPGGIDLLEEVLTGDPGFLKS